MIAQQSELRLSLVVAALNEERVIEKTVREIVAVTDGRFADYEIILVDDGSTDSTGAIMERLATELPQLKVIHHPTNIGLGAAYRRGVVEARFEYLMMLCGDGGLPAASLPAIYDAIGTADIVLPYMRNLKRIKTPLRYALSRTYTTLLNLLFWQNIRYYNGLPIHRIEYLRRIAITSTGFGFQGEILTKLLKSGCTYVEVGVDGAELTQNSQALRIKSVINVSRTLMRLILEIWTFDARGVKVPAVEIAGISTKRERHT